VTLPVASVGTSPLGRRVMTRVLVVDDEPSILRALRINRRPCLPPRRSAGRRGRAPRHTGPDGLSPSEPLLPAPRPIPHRGHPAACPRPRTAAYPPRVAVLAPATSPRSDPSRSADGLSSQPVTARRNKALSSPRRQKARLRGSR